MGRFDLIVQTLESSVVTLGASAVAFVLEQIQAAFAGRNQVQASGSAEIDSRERQTGSCTGSAVDDELARALCRPVEAVVKQAVRLIHAGIRVVSLVPLSSNDDRSTIPFDIGQNQRVRL